jgi:hypothetical protein
MSKQTAVEWLIDKIENNVHHTIRIPNEYFEQAKAMEKEQIIKSMGIAFNDALKIQEGKESIYNDWEQYYQETYGGDK